MKKTLKKLSALVLALAMVVAMSATVFADGDVDGKLTDGKDGMLYNDDNEGAKDVNTLTFPKEIILYNTTSAEVHHPAITYAYSIAPARGTNATVTDGDGDVGVVYDGVAAAASITESVTFANTYAETEVTPNGKVASEDITVTIDPSEFKHAGIYRYLITETDNSGARTAAGVSRGANYVNTRYLDVYVRRAVKADNVSTDYVVYGYVLFEGTNTSITSDETEVTKSQGFVGSETSGTYSTDKVDYYETYNLKVTKNIDGSLAETEHEFPFSVAFTATVTTDAVIEWAKGSTTTSEATITGSALTIGDATTTGFDSSVIKLADNEYVTFYGIPAGTTSVVSEINDTYDIYKAEQESIVGGTSTTPAVKNIAANHVADSIYSITAVANDTTLTSNSQADTQLQIKNSIEIVSPTGVVLRFGPYALMLGAGIALLILTIRRKSLKDED